ncbi:MAG: trimethylamine methyltransferase family protein [candidate division Zixibacteria bacterium]|nr:trimethylamine methyltransferase family protein [candidate division Zixibacteria bacterium]MDH3936413.1 trimethylamine methyltransferase family protein [candidate division Zixibacteria bacterium]MDH4034481.1 trimethylamine methyltransferase family protein [candidate division Zixibacteria bacterium]
MRPTVRFLSDELIGRILSEARELICKLGVEIHNENVLGLLGDHGARIDSSKHRAFYTDDIIDQSLKAAPSSFCLYDSSGNQAVDLSGMNVNFTPGSAAINILDSDSLKSRRPTTADYVKYARLVGGMDHIGSQSTALVADDVPGRISDSYRLYLSLMHCHKPVVTGAFTIDAFEIMKELQLTVRGSGQALKEKPLAVFSCCPTSPLKWCDVTSQNVVDCAKHSIPVEYISMPLSGFMAPVTLVGSLVQHTAETLSGLAISQLTNPGTPVLYGGSPAVFDLRYETTPMGAIGTMMIDCAYNEIGKHLGLPTQAYIALSDAKLLDAQAGLETSMGATLAALAGINNISGPGMLDFESCFSLEKLVVDNEICGMVHRMVKGIEPKEDFPALPRFEELLRDDHLLISPHTLKYLNEEIYLPGPVIDRANRSRWAEEGSLTIQQRAAQEVKRILSEQTDSPLPQDVGDELTRQMTAAARTHEMEQLPEYA